jgi:hypothetical protein
MMSVASHDLFNMKLRTCIDTGAACAENSIYEINEMLKENGITPLGSDPDLQ